MAQQDPAPFTIDVLRPRVEPGTDSDARVPGATDLFPASYHYYQDDGERSIIDSTHDVEAFISNELSLKRLDKMLNGLWLAGARRLPTQLHFQLAKGRKIVVVERMDLHLIWDTSHERIFLKPIPRFLLSQDFWRSNLKCPDSCKCQESVHGHSAAASCKSSPRQVAFGFLYIYACLISSETDFMIAKEARLLPSKECGEELEWADWKRLARELLKNYQGGRIHPRFLRGELRLSRLNILNCLMSNSPCQSYLAGSSWNNYGGFFSDNITWLATFAVFLALVLTAMQVGLALPPLGENYQFQQASYIFTIFTLLAPLCVFLLVIMLALMNLAKDIPRLLKDGEGEPRTESNDPSSV